MTITELIHRWFDDLWNLGDESAIDEVVSPAVIVRGLGDADLVGREEFRGFYRSIRAAFPNIRVTVDRVLESGDFATCLARVELVSADGRGPFRFEGSSTVRVEEGRFIEGWNYFDLLTLLRQMGAIRSEAVERGLTLPTIPTQ